MRADSPFPPTKRISSATTGFLKRGFPVLWTGLVAGFTALGFYVGAKAAPHREVWAFLLVPFFLAAVGYFIYKRLLSDLVDEVLDGGEYLLVRNGVVEERISLSNVMNVSASVVVNPPRITLRLVAPGLLGEEVTFVPARPFSLNPFKPIPIVDDLIVRVDRARLQRLRYLLGHQ